MRARYPIMPAITATTVPASNACCIKSYCHIERKSVTRLMLKVGSFMVMMRTFFGADDGQPSARIS